MSINPQEELFVRIHEEYGKHYYDKESMKYRRRFIYNEVFNSEDFNNKKIAELACGSGFNSLAILKKFPNANINGYDISEPACKEYKKLINSNAYVWDITKKRINNFKYDYVIIFGGIHHCINDLKSTFKNIYEMLNNNGTLIMLEPNKDCFLDLIRILWYKFDNYFESSTEDSLSHSKLLSSQKEKFKLKEVKYLGVPAYFLINNSMIFRLPLIIKPFISKLSFALEVIYNKFGFKWLYPAFIAKWTKL